MTLRKAYVKVYSCGKMYISKDLTEDELYQLIDQFKERKINHKDFVLCQYQRLTSCIVI